MDWIHWVEPTHRFKLQTKFVLEWELQCSKKIREVITALWAKMNIPSH
jgi:hypothetical protein